MPSIAILVANTEYNNLPQLDCCKADALAVAELLAATGKYDEIQILENQNYIEAKENIRSLLDRADKVEEVLFYYSGHGYSEKGDFFLCSKNFDSKRPNETGISTSELHTFLRLPKADLVVKVIDSCNSGTLLVKNHAHSSIAQEDIKGFKNLLQISSCLDTQSSLAGSPLSAFTEKFCRAALSKEKGVVYYTDIIAALRDQFIENEDQIPFFVSQHTGREQFVDDAEKLNLLRNKYLYDEKIDVESTCIDESAEESEMLTLLQVLQNREEKFATRDIINNYTSKFFQELEKELVKEDFGEIFEVEMTQHQDFVESTSKRFITQVLSREKRIDNFVTAGISRKRRRTNPLLGSAFATVWSDLFDDAQYDDVFELELNCEMERAQICMKLTPKFACLQRFLLTVTCAPSLEKCYIFEVATRHKLHDFGRYDVDGTTIIRNWYQSDWHSENDIATKVARSFQSSVNDELEKIRRQLLQ